MFCYFRMYSEDDRRTLKLIELKYNQLLKKNKDLFLKKYIALLHYFRPVLEYDERKKKIKLDFTKQDSFLSERVKHVSKHLVHTHDHKPLQE